MRILGLDIGDVKIGVAISDPLGWTAQGLKTIFRKEDSRNDLKELGEIINEYKVEKIVAGLPKNMNNTIGPQGEKVKSYCAELESIFKLPVEYIDERLSTMAVERTLIDANVSRSNRRKVVDKLAAAYILQTYLDMKGK
jgi:RNAse H-fold protein YqgF